MAKNDKKKQDDDAQGDGGGNQGGLGRMVMVGVLSLSIAAAGYFIGGRGGATSTAAEAPTEEVEEEIEHEVEEIVDLTAINVNLTDGHYLRVAISLGLAHHEDEGGGGGGHGAAEEPAPFPTAPAADLVLQTFAERSMVELSDDAGRTAARNELETHLKEYYGEDLFVTVFITEFVMQ